MPQLVAEHVPHDELPAIGADDPSLLLENEAKEEKTRLAGLPQRLQAGRSSDWLCWRSSSNSRPHSGQQYSYIGIFAPSVVEGLQEYVRNIRYLAVRPCLQTCEATEAVVLNCSGSSPLGYHEPAGEQFTWQFVGATCDARTATMTDEASRRHDPPVGCSLPRFPESGSPVRLPPPP